LALRDQEVGSQVSTQGWISDALSYGVIAGSGGGGHLLKGINKKIPKHPKEAPKAPLLDRRDEISLDSPLTLAQRGKGSRL